MVLATPWDAINVHKELIVLNWELRAFICEWILKKLLSNLRKV